MINLKVYNKLVVLPAGASISIEKNSPVLNDEVGAFSYPFPVPTIKNQKLLGYPGRLERAGDLSAKSFILDEDGIQILRGTVDYDDVTATETGLVLQSGATEFTKKMEGKKLADINFGREDWFTDMIDNAALNTKLQQWNARNQAETVIDYVALPFYIQNQFTSSIVVNETTNVSGQAIMSIGVDQPKLYVKYFSLQFSISWMLRKIYEAAGFRVVENQITDTPFQNICVFSKIIKVNSERYWDLVADDEQLVFFQELNYDVRRGPVMPYLNYQDLMPDFDVLDFIESAKTLLCLTVDINESLKTVSFLFNKELFKSTSLSASFNNRELKGWIHKEKSKNSGFKLFFQDQEDEDSSLLDFVVFKTVATEADKPEAKEDISDLNVYVSGVDRYYRCKKNDASEWYWQQIARLKPVVNGTSDNMEEFEVKFYLPKQSVKGDIDIPVLKFIISDPALRLQDTKKLYASMFQTQVTVSSVSYPVMSFDRYSLNGTIDFTTSLKPAYLYETVYKDFINWKTYRARECTKYLRLTLAEVVQLQWRKRYVISGIAILLNQVNFEVPYRGVVKINGFTT